MQDSPSAGTNPQDRRAYVPKSQKISWGIDAALAVFLIGTMVAVGKFLERVDTLVTRVEALETRPMSPQAHAQFRVLESRVEATDARARQFKEDVAVRLDRLEGSINAKLNRMDDKIDRLLTRAGP